MGLKFENHSFLWNSNTLAQRSYTTLLILSEKRLSHWAWWSRIWITVHDSSNRFKEDSIIIIGSFVWLQILVVIILGKLRHLFQLRTFAMKVRSIWLIMIRLHWKMVVLAIDVIILVRIFGTEDRKCEVFIGVVVDMKPIISFNRSGIQTISLIPQVLAPFTIHS